MTLKRSTLCSAFVCLFLIGSALAATPATELLYVQQGQNVITYSANTHTAATKKLGTLNTAYAGSLPIIINRSGAFLYLVGFTPSHEYFTVYSLTAAGVPNPKPVQTLTVKPSLHQFVIHPNGLIAYGMFSWSQVDGSGDTEYAGDAVLFKINPKTGTLTNTTKNVMNFGLSSNWSPSLLEMANKGAKLYFTYLYHGSLWAGTYYYEANVNATTGALGYLNDVWNDDNFNHHQKSVIGSSVLAQQDNSVAPYSNININPLTGGFSSFSCDNTMIVQCGDNFGPSLWLHPSNAYLFTDDESVHAVEILYINLPGQFLVASGASIPGNPSNIAFSPDGLLVYAVEGSQILTYVFNPHSGLLTARTIINAPGVLSILPRV
jgi:hypothetical protein